MLWCVDIFLLKIRIMISNIDNNSSLVILVLFSLFLNEFSLWLSSILKDYIFSSLKISLSLSLSLLLVFFLIFFMIIFICISINICDIIFSLLIYEILLLLSKISDFPIILLFTKVLFHCHVHYFQLSNLSLNYFDFPNIVLFFIYFFYL